MDTYFDPTLYWACDYFSMLGLKLILLLNRALGDSIWHNGFVSTLIQVMACYLFRVSPLPGPALTYRRLDSDEKNCVKIETKYEPFHSRNHINFGKKSSAKCWPFSSGLYKLNGNGQCHKQSYNAFIQYCLFHYAVHFIDCFETDMLISISCPGWYNKIGSDSVNIPYKLNLIMKTLV